MEWTEPGHIECKHKDRAPPRGMTTSQKQPAQTNLPHEANGWIQFYVVKSSNMESESITLIIW